MKSISVFRDYRENEVVFSQGDAGDCAYIIESGRIQISIRKNDEDFPVSVLGEGDIFGEMAILEGLPRAATAIALEPTRLCLISQDQLFQRIQNADPVVRLLVQILIHRTRSMNKNLGRKVSDEEVAIDDSQSKKGHRGREAIDQVKFEAELHKAFGEKEFRMHYQPIVDLRTFEVRGFEALIRWDSPTLGRMRPDIFMKVAEESSLIIPLGRWIQQQSIEDLQRFQNETGEDLFMSINVSGRQFTDPHYVEDLEATRARIGIPADRIKLEVTEKIFLNGSIAIKTIEKCRELGFQISLDDFGTGYSSLSYLKELVVDNLKVDQSFTRTVLGDKRSDSLVRCILNLSQDLGIKSVGEGIEDLQMALHLQKLGCDYGQGYYFAKPDAIDKILELLKSKSLKRAS